jgi:hypothetical protein
MIYSGLPLTTFYQYPSYSTIRVAIDAPAFNLLGHVVILQFVIDLFAKDQPHAG